MLFVEGHQIPKTKKLSIQYAGRDVYIQQSKGLEEKEFFLKEITPSKTFPIVLMGDWEDNELDPKFIDIIAFQHIHNPLSVAFITKEDEGIFDINVFGMIASEEIPHTYIGPIHSSHLLSWREFPKTWKINLESQRIQYETRESVAKNIID